jgi:hypothetical protein
MLTGPILKNWQLILLFAKGFTMFPPKIQSDSAKPLSFCYCVNEYFDSKVTISQCFNMIRTVSLYF